MHKKIHTVAGLGLLGVGAVVVVSAGCGESDDGIPAPYKLFAYPLSDTQVYLNWVENADNEEGMRIYRDGGSGFQEIDTVPANYTGYEDTNFVTGTVYTYYVVAFIGADESAHSNHATVEARAPYVDVLTPTGSDTFNLGDEIQISWTTNVPNFDARIFLSLDGGSSWLLSEPLQGSWTSSFSWTWKVGYRNTEENEDNPPQWEQLVMTTCDQCKILVSHYDLGPANGQSVGTFTIIVP